MTKQISIIRGDGPKQVATLLQEEKEIYIVHDKNVEAFASAIAGAIPADAIKAIIPLEVSEERKTMETAVGITEKMLEASASRKALVLAVGGGITTDLAGFAASMYKRGVRYANVPTTLLAQVDAAIGGKTSVNLHGFKNMLGAFHMPEFTYICTEALKTLPEKELKCGIAEMLKTYLIGDASAYSDALSKNLDSGLIFRAAQIKAGIVERDPLEHGERAVLNLGHTFGHAIERCSGGTIAHGEAVAIGIIMAAKLSEGLGLAAKGLAGRLEEDFKRLGLRTDCPYGIEALSEAMKKDKKDGKFVLLKEIGRPVITTVKEDDLYKYTK